MSLRLLQASVPPNSTPPRLLMVFETRTHAHTHAAVPSGNSPEPRSRGAVVISPDHDQLGKRQDRLASQKHGKLATRSKHKSEGKVGGRPASPID